MVADDPAARPAPEKLAVVVEVHEVTPDGPCRALDLVGGAPPSAEQGDVTPPHRGPGLAGRAFLKRSPSRELRGLPDLEPAADAPRKPPPVSPRVEVARDPRVAKFFLQLNKPALAYAEKRRDALEREGDRLDVVAVSHFLPLPELFPGPLLLKAVMGCAGLQKQIDKVDCVRVAVAGHSHINFDQDIDDVRYVQCALGHAERDESGARKARDLKPALLYSARPLYA